jgi:F-type H+-transporting ATPase subunit b
MTTGIASLIALTAGGVALAAEAGEGGGGGDVMALPPVQYLAAIILFILAYMILSKGAWPKIMKGLEDRENKIREEIAAAEDARKQADTAMQEYQTRLAEAKAEAAKLLAETKAEQSRLAADLKVKAEAELNELREQARQGIEAAKRAAINEIYRDTVTLSTMVAEKILQRELNEADQRQLVEETLGEFTGRQAAGAGA